jgi:hypothetical protein
MHTRAHKKATQTDASTPARRRPSILNLWRSEEIQMTHSINTTRRGLLSTAAALAASATVPIPASAFGADPILEAIGAHKTARLAFENAVSRGSALENELPSEKTRSWITVWEQTIVETDDPRWIDSVHAIDRASDAATDAAYALASIAPTTMAGVVASLQYAISIEPEDWPDGVQSDDDTETRPWHYFLIEMLIAVLPGMTVRS